MNRATKLIVFSWVALLGFGCGSDAPQDTTTCGEGTELVGGECIATDSGNDITCGDGTILSGTECVPESTAPPLTCGPGTTLKDDVCEPDVACGPDTMPNMQGECVPTNVVVCGDDTLLTDGTCEVDPSKLTQCSGSTVLVDLECLTREEALALTPPIASAEPDDPNYPNGIETSLTLPPVGEFLVASGVIDIPLDLDQNGQLDQDEDYFLFTGAAGDVLEVELVNDGLAEPHVSLAYKDEATLTWSKTLPENVTINPIRHFVLPRAGEYQLVVTHAAKYRQLVPRPILGSPEYKYFIVIEHAPALAPADATLPTTMTGEFSNHIASAIKLPSPGVNFALASATGDFDAFEGEINAYDADGLFSATTLGPTPLAFAVKDDATLVPEWRQIAPGDDAFTIDIAPLPVEPLPSTKTGQANQPDVISFFSVEPGDDTLLEIEVVLDSGATSDLQPVIALVNYDLDNVTQVFTTTQGSVKLQHYIPKGAPYLIVVADAQPSAGTDLGYSISFGARTVTPLGALTPANTPGTGTIGPVDGTANTTALFAFKNDHTGAGRFTTSLSPQTATEALSATVWSADVEGTLSSRAPVVSGAPGETVVGVHSIPAQEYVIYEVAATTMGTTQVDISSAFAAPLEVNSAPNAPINANAPVVDTVSIASACTVAEVSVEMNISHTYIGDVTIDLMAPDGTTVRLWNRTGGGQDDIIGNFPATLASAESLSGFIGTAGLGDWQLTVSDAFPGDDGVLNSWGLQVFCQ